MASAAQLSNWEGWIAANPDKQGTPDYAAVMAAIDEAAQRKVNNVDEGVRLRREALRVRREKAAVREIEFAAEQAELAEREAAPDYADMSALRRGFSRGIDNAGVMAGSAVEGLGRSFDSDYLVEQGQQQIAENEAQLAQQQKYAPATRLSDVSDINTFLDYFLETLGETAPLTGASIGAALAAPVVLPASATALTAAAVGTAAAAATQLPFFYGGNREAQKDAINQGLKLEVDEGTAFLSAIPQAALDVIAERLTLFGARMLPGAAATGGLLTRGVKAAGRGVVSEVPTELGQQVIERAQANLDLTSDEAIEGYIEVAVAAGLIGGTIGGTAGLAGIGQTPPPPAPPSPDEAPVLSDVKLDDPADTDVQETTDTQEQASGPITPEEQVTIDKVLAGATLTPDELKSYNTKRIYDAVQAEKLKQPTEPPQDLAAKSDARVKLEETVEAVKEERLFQLEKQKRKEELEAKEAAALEAEQQTADEPVETDDTVDVDTLTSDEKDKLLNDLTTRIGAPVVEPVVEPVVDDAAAAEEAKKAADKARNDAAVEDAANKKRGDNFAPKMDGGLLSAIARLGGINRNELKGMGLEDSKGVKKGNKYVFSTNGLPLDSMVEALIEEGYLPPQPKDGTATTDINLLQDYLNEALLDPNQPKYFNREPPQSFVDKQLADDEFAQLQQDEDRQQQDENQRLEEEGEQAQQDTVDQEEQAQDIAAAEEDYGPNFKGAREEYLTNVIGDPSDALNKLLDKVDDGEISAKESGEIINQGAIEKQGGRTAPATGEVVETAPEVAEVAEETAPEVVEKTAPEEDRVPITEALLTRMGFAQKTAARTRLLGDKYKDQTFNESELIEVFKVEAGETRTQKKMVKDYEKERAAGTRESITNSTIAEQLAATDDSQDSDPPDSLFRDGPRYEDRIRKGEITPKNLESKAEGETQAQLNERLIQEKYTPDGIPTVVPPSSQIKVVDGYATQKGADNAGKPRTLTAEEISNYESSAEGIENRALTDAKLDAAARNQAAKDSIVQLRSDEIAVGKILSTVSQASKVKALTDEETDVFNEYARLRETDELAAEQYLQEEQESQDLTDKSLSKIRDAADPTTANLTREAAFMDRDASRQIMGDVSNTDSDMAEGRFLLASAVASNAEPINNAELRDAIGSGNIELTISTLAKTSKNKMIKTMARKLSGKLDGVKIEVRKNLRDNNNRLVAGHFDPKTNTVLLDIDKGFNTHTLLHETYHALTIAPLSNKANPTTRQLQTLFDDTKDSLGSIYGAGTLEEFVAEARSNPEFRTDLARINPKGGELSALQRFTNIMRRMINNLLGTKFNSGDALTTADVLVESILAPEPNSRNADFFSENSTFDDLPKVIGQIIEDPQKAIQDLPITPEKSWKENTLRLLSSNGGVGLAQEAVWKTMDMNRFRWVAEAIGVGDIVGRIQRTSDSIRADQNAYEEKANMIANSMKNWIGDTEGSNGEALLDKLIYDKDIGATIHNVNPLLSKNAARKVYDAEKMDIWEQQRDTFRELQNIRDSKGKNGMQIYREMRDHYTNTLNELNSTIKGVIEDLPTLSKEQKTKLTSDVFEKMFDKNFTDTYFPLIRQGRYKVAYTVKNPTSLEGVEAGATDSTVVEMVDTLKQARHLVSDLQRDPAVAEVLNMEKEGIIDTKYENKEFIRSAPPKAYVNKLLNEMKSMEVSEGVSDLVVSTFIDFLPETSFAHSLRQRKNTVGYIPSAQEAMLTKGYDIGRQAQRIKGMARLGNIESEISEMRKGYDVAKYPVAPAVFNRFFDEVDTRLSFMRSPPNDYIWKTINQYGFIYTIGFNVSSAVVNLSQIPLFVMPYLMPIYGTKTVGSTFKEVGELVGGTGRLDLGSRFRDKRLIGMDTYYKFSVDDKGVTTFGLDKNAIPANRLAEVEAVEPLLRGLVDRGQLNKGGFLFEQLRSDEAGTSASKRNPFQRLADVITETSAVAFNAAERFNRQVTSIAIYKLELAKRIQDVKDSGSTLTDAAIVKSFDATTMDEIVDYAIRTTIAVNGNTFLETAAPITQKGFLRSALMYKGFGFQMYHTMLRAGMQAIDNAFPKNAGNLEQQAESRKLRNQAVQQLLNWHLSTALIAGVAGTPLYGMLQMMFDLYYDDEEEDFDTRIRTSDYMNELFFKGFTTALTGADVSARVKLNDLLIQDNRYNSAPSPEEFIGFQLGGPALSSVKRNIRGIKDLTEGNWYRGIENILPPAFSNFFKASPIGRLQSEGGYTTRRGDPIYDDVSTGEMAAQIFGFAPAEYTKRQEENMSIKKIDTAVNKKRSKLLKKYYMATRMQNDQEQSDAFNDILEFNDRHPAFAISAPNIRQSLKGHVKQSATMHNGVAFSSKMQRVLDDYLFETEAPPVR